MHDRPVAADARADTMAHVSRLERPMQIELLLSDRASYVTGSVLEVDGGWSAVA